MRLLYMHPDHFPMGIVDRIKADPRILPYFDIPFQHASREILGKMGRRGDSETYLKLIGDLRHGLPNVVIRSTFLVGFPGESKADFAVLEEFQQKAQLDWLGVFSYSKEEGTVAAGYQGDLSYRLHRKTRDKRRELLMERQMVMVY